MANNSKGRFIEIALKNISRKLRAIKIEFIVYALYFPSTFFVCLCLDMCLCNAYHSNFHLFLYTVGNSTEMEKFAFDIK